MLEKYWKCYNSPTDGPIGTKPGWSKKTVSLVLVVTANRIVNVLVSRGVL